jgi:hypothetical protein
LDSGNNLQPPVLPQQKQHLASATAATKKIESFPPKLNLFLRKSTAENHPYLSSLQTLIIKIDLRSKGLALHIQYHMSMQLTKGKGHSSRVLIMVFRPSWWVVVVAFLASAACSKAETITNATATACTFKKKSSKCRFNSNNLQLDTGTAIQLVVRNGRKINCRKLAVKKANVWHGQCDGDARDANFIQRKDLLGISRVYGSIRVGSDICRIAPNSNGTDEIACVADSEFIAEEEAIAAPPEGDYAAQVRNLQFGFHPEISNDTDTSFHSIRGGGVHGHRRLPYDDSGSNIDVMVVWTSEAECKNSGLNAGCTLTATTENNIRGLIDLAVAETNTAFELSGILSSLRLVHAYRDPTYVEPTTDVYETALDNLGSVADGSLDSVHTFRALYGADMVQMLISTSRSRMVYVCAPNYIYIYIYIFI